MGTFRACGLRLGAYGAGLTAYGLRLTAQDLRLKTQGVLVAGLMVVEGVAPTVALLRPETVAAWKGYVEATERRRDTERDPAKFLAMDYQPGIAADRRALASGEIVVRKMETRAPNGDVLEIAGGLMHHWRGAVFIPNTTVAAVMDALETAPPAQDDVLEARVLERGPQRMRVFLKLRRTKVVTVVYNTEHTVTFERFGATRAASESVATKIAEVDGYGTGRETEHPVGDDRGFLWRLNSYWRYEARDGGVIAECESLSLSRGIPFGFGYLLGSIVEGTARESMDRTLIALRTAFARAPRQTPPSSSPAR